jgi:hypothetical protein
MTTPEFYPPTKAILESRPELFVKVEAHVASDPESSDLLWLEYTPEDELSEGEVICISPFGDSWYVSRDSAFKYGGWTTDWDTTGTADDVFLACSDIQKKSEAMTSQTRKEMDELLDALEQKNGRLTDDLEAMDLDSKSLWDEVNALKVANSDLAKAAENVLSILLRRWIDDGVVLNIEEKAKINALRIELNKVKP